MSTRLGCRIKCVSTMPTQQAVPEPRSAEQAPATAAGSECGFASDRNARQAHTPAWDRAGLRAPDPKEHPLAGCCHRDRCSADQDRLSTARNRSSGSAPIFFARLMNSGTVTWRCSVSIIPITECGRPIRCASWRWVSPAFSRASAKTTATARAVGLLNPLKMTCAPNFGAT